MKKFLIIAVAIATLGFTAAYAGAGCCAGGKAKDKGSESTEK